MWNSIITLQLLSLKLSHLHDVSLAGFLTLTYIQANLPVGKVNSRPQATLARTHTVLTLMMETQKGMYVHALHKNMYLFQ